MKLIYNGRYDLLYIHGAIISSGQNIQTIIKSRKAINLRISLCDDEIRQFFMINKETIIIHSIAAYQMSL